MLRRVDEKEVKSIVLMDDETSFTDFLGSMLEEHFRCAILTFSDPLVLLEALPRLNIGVLVTDYYMPHLSGIDLIHKAAELMPVAPPCILITGHTFEEEEDESARPPHFKAILPKPFRWQELATLIERYWPADAPSPLRNPA